MIITVSYQDRNYKIDTSSGVDLSLELSTDSSPNAWHVENPRFEPVRHGDFIGSIKDGAPVNFYNVFFNPHGSGTHTESVQHIWDDGPTIKTVLTDAFLLAEVISIIPVKVEEDTALSKVGDQLITLGQMKSIWSKKEDVTALVIRTNPNTDEKASNKYSGSNPCYFEPEAISWIVNNGIDHILVDLPSLDREEDGGKVLAHHRFWEHPENTQEQRTITELIFVPDSVKDGTYALNIQTAPFKLDVSPSRPILFNLKE